MEKLRRIASKRIEIVWTTGSPLRRPYTELTCDYCSKSVDAAIVYPIGYSWRGGWVYLCRECFDVIDKEYDISWDMNIERYTVRVMTTAETAKSEPQ